MLTELIKYEANPICDTESYLEREHIMGSTANIAVGMILGLYTTFKHFARGAVYGTLIGTAVGLVTKLDTVQCAGYGALAGFIADEVQALARVKIYSMRHPEEMKKRDQEMDLNCIVGTLNQVYDPKTDKKPITPTKPVQPYSQ